MTKAQRAAVIELKRQHGTNKSSNGDDTRRTSQVSLDDMITLGDAIVAGVKRASISNGDADDNGENADDETSAA